MKKNGFQLEKLEISEKDILLMKVSKQDFLNKSNIMKSIKTIKSLIKEKLNLDIPVLGINEDCQLEKLELTNNSVFILKYISGKSEKIIEKAVKDIKENIKKLTKLDVLIIPVSDEKTLEMISVEDMNKAGWKRI
jgi:hypothetical protein